MHTQKKHIQLILSISLYGKNDVKMNQIHLEKVKNLIHLLKDFAISILNSSVDSWILDNGNDVDKDIAME